MTMSRSPSRAEAGPLARVSWALFDWAAQPFFTLVTTFVFAPYFATALAETPARGQELWGYVTAAVGLVIALSAPVLGSIADASGHRKPWILAFSIPFVVAMWMLWYAAPGSSMAIPIALLAFGFATLAIEFATIFNNAMMVDLVSRERIGRLSGLGWALGYAGGLVSLVLVLGLMASNPESGKTLLGLAPLFGLDAVAREGDRASGPFSAVWYVVFVLPMFLFVPDAPKKAPLGLAVRKGLSEVGTSLQALKGEKGLITFLLANMAYKDGLVALFAFGGIYASGQLGWETIEIGIFGILLTITGTLGALAGGRLDDRFGPRAVLLGALAILMVSGLGLISLDRTTVFFVVDVVPSTVEGLFSSLPDQVFLALGGFIGAAAGPLQAASRSYLVQLAPPDRITQSFGLLALSGKVTSFMCPLAVGLITAATGSQRWGMSVILVFFLAGAALLRRVEARG
ncbi:MFS transporter [Roseibium sp.]|uniref:MFS transporter n=1 Tax=Roseibium sp. TaxID=1936156 RepID=UPI003A97F1B6